MEKKSTVLTSESLADFLGKLPEKIDQILDSPDFDKPAKKSLMLLMQSMKRETNDIFSYLPEGERRNIMDNCITWMDIGLFIGHSPRAMVELLLENKSKLEKVVDDLPPKPEKNPEK
jgi:hypothetical protein